MFVAARSLRANVCEQVFTHYKREEDETMEGGKLDEEFPRMSQIAERIRPSCLLLCNQSFASHLPPSGGRPRAHQHGQDSYERIFGMPPGLQSQRGRPGMSSSIGMLRPRLAGLVGLAGPRSTCFRCALWACLNRAL